MPHSLPIGVDTHAHVFHAGLTRVASPRHAPDYDAPLDVYLDLLDASHLTHGVVVQPSFLGADNGFLLASLARAPQRLRGVAVIDPDTSQATLDELARAGVVGVRLNLIGKPLPDLGAGPWPDFLQMLRERDWHLEIHLPGRDLATVMAPALRAGCRIVVDHFGRPDPARGLDDPGLRHLIDCAASRQVWVKLSAPYRTWAQPADAIPCARALLDAFGVERLLWGSDWPHTEHREHADHARSLGWLDLWIPDPQDRAIILGDTARSLFQLPRGDTPS